MSRPTYKYPRKNFLSKKQSFTRFITEFHASSLYWSVWPNYLSLPRKQKKQIKRHVRLSFHYTRKYGVTVFNPYMLLTPVPKGIFDMFRGLNLPPVASKTMVFKRYSQREDPNGQTRV